MFATIALVLALCSPTTSTEPPAAPPPVTISTPTINLAPKLTPGTTHAYTYTRETTQQVFGRDQSKPNTERRMRMVVGMRLTAKPAVNDRTPIEVTYESPVADLALPTGQVSVTLDKTYPPNSPELLVADRLRTLAGKSVTIEVDSSGRILRTIVPPEDARKLAEDRVIGRFFDERLLGIVLQPMLGLKTDDKPAANVGQSWSCTVASPETGGLPLGSAPITQNRSITSADSTAASIAIDGLSDLSSAPGLKQMPGAKLTAKSSGQAVWDLAAGALRTYAVIETVELTFNLEGDPTKPVRNSTVTRHNFEPSPPKAQ